MTELPWNSVGSWKRSLPPPETCPSFRLPQNGYTPLHIAAKKNQMDIGTTLLEYGADTNAVTRQGISPIHLAAQEGSVDLVSLLLAKHANVNVCNKVEGQTSLSQFLPKTGGMTESQICATSITNVSVCSLMCVYRVDLHHCTWQLRKTRSVLQKSFSITGPTSTHKPR